MKTIITVLVLFAACLFSLAVLAQDPPQVPANNPLDMSGQRQTGGAVDAGQDLDILWLGGRIDGLNSQLAGLKSARDSVARARIGRLAARVKALEDARARLPTDLIGRAEVVVMIDDAIKAAGGAPASGPGPPQTAVEGLNLDRRLGEVEENLSARIARLQEQIYALDDRVDGVERQLQRRAVRFDAAFWASVHRGGEAVGGLGAVTWPLGQDGDWALRGAFGVGQNWTLLDGERYQAIGLITKADLLHRWDSVSAGLTVLAELGVAPNGLRFTDWLAGATVRADLASWLFAQASAGTGRARSPLAQLQWGYGGTLEVGFTFP